MIRFLVLLLDLLTNCPAVDALAGSFFTVGLANTAIACLMGSFEVVRRMKHRGTTASLSHA